MSTSNRRVLLFTGDGKGKTTAALGMLLRASGHGMRVLMVQFIKSDTSTGELAGARHLPGVEIVLSGKGFIPPPAHPQYSEHAAAAQNGLRLVREALAAGKHEMLILDEICTAIAKNLLAEASVLEVLNQAQENIILVLTGRGAAPGLIALADTVSEVRCVKHGMSIGIAAQKGVES